MDKKVETCGQERGDLSTGELRLVVKRGETCGQGSGDLWKTEWRLVDKRAVTCGHMSGDLWVYVVGIQNQILLLIDVITCGNL